MDYLANPDLSWSFADGEATLSHDGVVDGASPWVNSKFLVGDCGWDGAKTVFATQDLGTTFKVQVYAKSQSTAIELALTVNSTESGLEIAAQKDAVFTTANTYETLTYEFTASDLGTLENFNSIEGLSFAMVSASALVANDITIDWIKVGSFVDDTPTGVEDDKLAASTKITPNPASNVASVSFEGNAAAVTVSDLTGNQVASVEATNGQAEINVDDLASGIYIVNIATGNSIATKRLIVE